jgi:hypothetical protein
MAPKGAAIDHLGVYPPIGISRVGLSEETFLAPELPGVAPSPLGGFKKDGKLKRQVQRFFIFAFDKQGRVIKEITAGSDAQINWQVHVANTKAAWFGFNNPFDLDDSAKGIPSQLRNDGVIGDEDRLNTLVIDSGKVDINGRNTNTSGKQKAYELAGTFWKDHGNGGLGGRKNDVHLGALQTDKDGRLQVIPASGVSKSVIDNNMIVDFTKNDAWYDDWCDGTVKAEVKIGDKTYTAKPAWVACCGPNFAPEIAPFTSMYDSIANAMVKKYESAEFAKKDKRYKRPTLPLSFEKDIYPIFYRLGLMEWVASAATTREGWLKVGNFSDVDYIKKLANLDNEKLRAEIFNQFRDPNAYSSKEGAAIYSASPKLREEYRLKLPYMVGSGVDYDASAEHWFGMPDLQYWILEQWSKGKYNNDFTGKPAKAPTTIHELPIEQQPEALTRAALEPLSGGNFHPGVELTWVLRHGELFEDDEPFRLKLGNRDSLIQNRGPLLTKDKIFPPKSGDYEPDDYPIGPQMPGDLTRWMGLPWQPDAFSCQNVNYANDFPTVVWWPALLPVDVMPEFAYQQLHRDDLSRQERLKFASVRVPWARGAAGIGYHANASYFDGLNRMVYLVDQMGVVVKQKTPPELTTGEGKLPEYLYVEMDRGSMDLEFNQPPSTGLGEKV